MISTLVVHTALRVVLHGRHPQLVVVGAGAAAGQHDEQQEESDRRPGRAIWSRS